MAAEKRHDPSDVERTAHEENSKFEVLYADVAPALYAWAELRIRPSLRAQLEPQDLVQEIWLRGRRSFGSFDARGVGFRPWAFRIGKNILMEALRASRSDASPQVGGSPTKSVLALDRIPESVTSFTQRLAREDSMRAFLAEAQALDESDRMLLVHCGLEAESCAEAAVKLGLSEDAAIKRWQRLKARLRELPWSRRWLGLDPDQGPPTSRPDPSPTS
jgi:RNA polymerase sigma factor (sigma-70 family)